ncbi:MAG: hypothetical protein STHCBS139747_005628 [Sporothrix thermara]
MVVTVTAVDLASYVLPLDSRLEGNTFPGVSEPFGMVELGSDMDIGPAGGESSYSGYVPGNASLTGFSMLHENGTGGAPRYGVVSQAHEASPGSYKATLSSGIVVELAASARAGLSTNRAYLSQHYLGGNISDSSDPDGNSLRYMGAGTYDHDIYTLISYSGGDTTFSDRLAIDFNNTILNPGNEPSFTTPYLFNFVGRQDLSVKYSRAAADAYYQPTPGGLPGNRDAGAMESWSMFLIGSISLGDGDGKTLRISSTTESSDEETAFDGQRSYRKQQQQRHPKGKARVEMTITAVDNSRSQIC